jgi:hypothetical protein
MMMAEVAVILKLMGSKMDMVATGPRPGRTPISVPMKTPTKQAKRLFGSKLTEKP